MASTKVELIRDIQSVLFNVDLHQKTADTLWKIIARAKKGYYHDFESPVATPKMDLYGLLSTIHVARVREIAEKVKSGYYDE